MMYIAIFLIIISATSYMAWHTPLRYSEDFVNAVKAARKLAEDITETLNKRRRESNISSEKEIKVFAYRYTYMHTSYFIYMAATVVVIFSRSGAQPLPV